MERLDRAFANNDRFDIFPHYKVLNLIASTSDHNPIRLTADVSVLVVEDHNSVLKILGYSKIPFMRLCMMGGLDARPIPYDFSDIRRVVSNSDNEGLLSPFSRDEFKEAVFGHVLTDNVMVAFDLSHHMKNKSKRNAKEMEVLMIKRILCWYEDESGQSINFHKSGVMFSTNTSKGEARGIYERVQRGLSASGGSRGSRWGNKVAHSFARVALLYANHNEWHTPYVSVSYLLESGALLGVLGKPNGLG
ncbi:hypothetical protein GOBAR_DD30798 [Gossypium barbadense]|nr:hypothetical protein GOBAR_DD30798 [Gossypium barbadense]